MLEKMCAECKNYFCKIEDIHFGAFKIESGAIEPLDFLQEGQYFRIVDSVFNDGIYQYPAVNLIDETFRGAIWAMAVPPSVVALSDEIKKYVESDAEKPSNFISESFGGYSYSKATDNNGAPLSWEKVFASRLNKYRRVSVL